MGKNSQGLDWLSGGGEMGALIRAQDWSNSPVGPPESWPQSLRTALSICLGSKFPMFVWWGEDLTVFYNDSYIPFTGLKHPKYLGRPAREQWAEIWGALQPLTEQVLQTGTATWADSMLLYMTRKGFLEETYFTFSYSPIRDETGAVGGIINPCQETTDQVLSERRLKTLHDLGTEEVKDFSELGALIAQVLRRNTLDIPFALIYLTLPENPKTVTLISSFGVNENGILTPKNLEWNSASAIWPLSHLWQSRQPQCIDGLRASFLEELPQGPHAERPDSAYALPLQLANQDAPVGCLILGISPRLKFDHRYEEFFGLIGKHITTHLSNLKTLEEEKKRAEALAAIDRTKTEFFSNVSHEFRTPLTLLLGPIEEMLSRGRELPSDLRGGAEIIYRNALRLLKLVNSLLDFSRIEAGRAQVHYESTDLVSLTTDLASSFRAAIEGAHLKFTVQCEPLSNPIFVDRDMWEKIVLNLLSNAFKYTIKGEISVILRTLGDQVELSVADTGIMMSERSKSGW